MTAVNNTDKVEEILAIANLAPWDADFGYMLHAVGGPAEWTPNGYVWLHPSGKYRSVTTPNAVDALLNVAQEFPDLHQYLKRQRKPDHTFEQFLRIRDFVSWLADDSEDEVLTSLPMALTVAVRPDGTLTTYTEYYVEALLGVDVRRIKRCPVCRTVFWQSRADKKACSKKCSQVLASRKYRRSPAHKREKNKGGS